MIATNVEPAVHIKSLFSDSVQAGILSYLNDFVPMLSLGYDDTGFVRYYAHNLPFLKDIHSQLTGLASELAKTKLKPSYVFLSMYQDNGTCPLHIDRPQCRFTIDYLAQTTAGDPWPIRVSNPMTDEELQAFMQNDGVSHPSTEEEIERRIDSEEWHEINLKVNDAVFYSGTNQWHYRPTVLQGTADLIFFHFVKEDFDGSLD